MKRSGPFSELPDSVNSSPSQKSALNIVGLPLEECGENIKNWEQKIGT